MQDCFIEDDQNSQGRGEEYLSPHACHHHRVDLFVCIEWSTSAKECSGVSLRLEKARNDKRIKGTELVCLPFDVEPEPEPGWMFGLGGKVAEVIVQME